MKPDNSAMINGQILEGVRIARSTSVIFALISISGITFKAG
jgi:hypothetical protein